MKTAIILLLIILPVLSCNKDKVQFGTCEIQYNDISGQPSSSLLVVVTNQNSVSLKYSLTPGNNSIVLPLETGYSYIVKTGQIRIDSVYDIRFVWSDNKVEFYTFMFNNTRLDMTNNKVIINLLKIED